MAQPVLMCQDTESRGKFDAGLTARVTLLGDRNRLALIAVDARGMGFAVSEVQPLRCLLDDPSPVLGEIVVVDCSILGGAELAALVRLDEWAQRSGAQLVVLSDQDGLEDVFGCLEANTAQILVDPTPAQCAIALGAAMIGAQGKRVRELDDRERLSLARLTEEVGRLAAKLDRLALPFAADADHSLTARLASPGIGYRGPGDRQEIRRSRAPLPDPRLIQQIIRQRRLRNRYFESELFADPAWDILLDLTAARAEHRRVAVTSLCIAAAVPATTALRWIAQMTEMGILVREQDEEDKRRAFIALSDKAADAMARYFDELGRDAAKLI